MTRFKNALLDEMISYTRSSEPVAHPTRSRRRWYIRAGSLAGAGAAAAIAAFLVVSTGPQAAYAVDTNPDGTVSVTFRELGHAAEATRDLRAAGVPAQVVRLAAPGSCATVPGGEPMEGLRAYSIAMPSVYPFQGDISAWLPATSQTSLTINPSAIPADAVLFIIEHSSPQAGVMLEAGLVNHPAPTCWEAGDLSGPARTGGGTVPQMSPTGTP